MDDELLFRISDKSDGHWKTFHPYKGVSVERNMTYLSGIITGNTGNDKIAIAMAFLPQIIFFDLEDGSIQSVAVNRAYHDWESVFSRPFDINFIEYYLDATSDSEYIFALYAGCSLGSILQGDYGSSIHVFDWKGHFLREFHVKEAIDKLAFDNQAKILYCVDKPNGRVVRYDLSEFLQWQ